MCSVPDPHMGGSETPIWVGAPFSEVQQTLHTQQNGFRRTR